MNSHILAVLKAGRVGAILYIGACASNHIRQINPPEKHEMRGPRTDPVMNVNISKRSASRHVCYCLQGVALSAQASLLPSYTLHSCLNIRRGGSGRLRGLWKPCIKFHF